MNRKAWKYHCYLLLFVFWTETTYTNKCISLIFVTLDTSSLSESALKEQIEKLNRENSEHSHVNAEGADQNREDGGSGGLILDRSHAPASQTKEGREESKENKDKEEERDVSDDTEAEEEQDDGEEKGRKLEDDVQKRLKGESEEASLLDNVISDMSKTSQERYSQPLSLLFSFC